MAILGCVHRWGHFLGQRRALAQGQRLQHGVFLAREMNGRITVRLWRPRMAAFGSQPVSETRPVTSNCLPPFLMELRTDMNNWDFKFPKQKRI